MRKRIDANCFLEKGFTLIEVVVAIGLVLMLIVGGVAMNQIVAVGVEMAQSKVSVNKLLQEGMEAVLSVRANDFTVIEEGVFHPEFDDSSGWSLVSNEEVIGNFTRRIRVDRVLRSIGCGKMVCEIVTGGGVVDSGSYWVTVEVDWVEKGESRQESLKNLVTYWR